MNYLVAIIVIYGVIWLFRHLIRNNPRITIGHAPRIAGLALLFGAGVLLLQGKPLAALVPGLVGFGLVAYSMKTMMDAVPDQGKKATVATALLSMELDHDSGRLEGKILSGTFSGRSLAELNDHELSEFFDACHSARDQSLALFQAWLDRARPEWREVWSGRAGAPGRAAQAKGMDRNEALAILGLTSNASEGEIRTAHRTLIKGCHPDKGGSHYLAAKINQAKDALLQS